ncbi:hypothetical protein C0J52_06523 [Blattella germanica]|nr:hypothetical protein C0J52_06523 [Blattella germanica]
MLINCAKDSETTIRFGVIRAISKATKYNLEIVEDRVLLEILENLILDTNKVVHKEAITTLGLIYRRIMDSEHNMVSVTKWLVNKLMHLFKTPYDFNDLIALILTCDLLSSYKELPVKNISFINWNRENIAGKLSLTMGYKLDLHTSLCLLTKELITNKRLYNFLEKYVEEGNCAEDFEKLWVSFTIVLAVYNPVTWM